MNGRAYKYSLYILAFAGLIVSAYLSYSKLFGTPVFCTIGSCDVVQNSKYSEIFGIPVAFFGIAFYFMLLAFAHYEKTKYLVVWTAIGFIFSAYLTYLELYVIHAICQWCVLSAIFATVAFVMAITYPKREQI